MICEYCGSRIFDDDRNCVRCGAPIPKEHLPDRNRIIRGGIGNQQLYYFVHDSRPMPYTAHKGENL